MVLVFQKTHSLLNYLYLEQPSCEKELIEPTIACSKLTIKTRERCQCRRLVVFLVNFKHISHLFLVLLSLTLSRLMPTGKLDIFEEIENFSVNRNFVLKTLPNVAGQ